MNHPKSDYRPVSAYGGGSRPWCAFPVWFSWVVISLSFGALFISAFSIWNVRLLLRAAVAGSWLRHTD